jgi:hypothetical protein
MGLVNSFEQRADVVIARHIPSDIPQRLANGTKRLLGEERPRALTIGTHPTMDYNVGNLLLWDESFPREIRESIVDSPSEVLERLRELARTQYKQFDVVLAAYDTHHFNSEQLADVLELTQILSRGSVVAMDYAIADVPHDEAIDVAQRKIDRKVLRTLGGPEAWVRSHRIFSEQSFHDAMQKPGWKSAQKFRLSDFGAGFIGSTVFSQSEMNVLTMNALVTRKNAINILSNVDETAY